MSASGASPGVVPACQTAPGARGPPNGGTGILSIPELPMSNKRLKTLRTLAFHAQNGRCFYCAFPMWLSSPDELGLCPRSARPFQCSAEHLLAKQDGGSDTPENVVAAHVVCNQRRHRITPPPSPDTYLTRVSLKIAKNKWHPRSLNLKARAMVVPAPTSLL